MTDELRACDWAHMALTGDPLEPLVLDRVPATMEGGMKKKTNKAADEMARANAALPQDDPRKITHEKLDLLDILADGVSVLAQDNAGLDDADEIRAFATALRSLLPSRAATTEGGAI